MNAMRKLMVAVGAVAAMILWAAVDAEVAMGPTWSKGRGLFNTYEKRWKEYRAYYPTAKKASDDWILAEAKWKSAVGTPYEKKYEEAEKKALAVFDQTSKIFESKIDAFYNAEDAWKAHCTTECKAKPRCTFKSLGRAEGVPPAN